MMKGLSLRLKPVRFGKLKNNSMKKILIVLCLILTVVVLGIIACQSRNSEPLKESPFVVNDDQISNGESVFMANCQKCHPGGGEGGLGPAINANPAPAFIKRFQMRHGLGTMPSFKKNEISKEDLHDITKYLKSWKQYK